MVPMSIIAVAQYIYCNVSFLHNVCILYTKNIEYIYIYRIYIVKGSLDEKLPIYERDPKSKRLDSFENRFVRIDSSEIRFV